MRRAALAVMCVVAIGAIGVAPASAKIGVNAAKRATARVAARHCANDSECVKSTARYCDRKTDTRMACSAFAIYRRGIERVNCRAIVVWVKTNGGALRQVNDPSWHCS